LVNLAQGFTGSTLSAPGFLYWIGVVIFFLLGSAVALIFSETAHSKAFLLGVSLPAFIAAAQTQTGLTIPTATPPKLASTSWFIGHAYGQQSQAAQPPAGPEAPRNITVKPLQPCKDCELWFYSPQGDVIEKKYIPNLDTETSVSVPTGATKFGIWNSKINPKVWALPSSSNVNPTYQFSYDYNRWNDLKRGLGDYNTRSYDPTIAIVPKSQ
jgi:hypothetical protein